LIGCNHPVLSSKPQKAQPLDQQTLSRLAGGLAHELKNPLSTITLHLELLREDLQKLEGSAHRHMRSIDLLKQEVCRLDEILADFLLFARTDTLEMERLDLNQLVDRVCSFAIPEAQARGIDIDVFLDASLAKVSGDPGRLRQAILNLLINARQAMDESGGHISLFTRSENGKAIVEVVDDGPGMDSDTLNRCFEVYFSRRKGGSGLGLPTVRRIIEAHGGEFILESTLGVGTRARISLECEDCE